MAVLMSIVIVSVFALVLMLRFLLAENRNARRSDQQQDACDEDERSKHRMQERCDAAAEVKISQDASPFEKSERSENAGEDSHRRRGARARQSNPIKTNKLSAKM